MLDHLTALYTQLTSLDLSRDKKYSYMRLGFLVLYQSLDYQIRMINAKNADTTSEFVPFLLIQLLLMSTLQSVALCGYTHANDMIFHDLRLEHEEALRKLDRIHLRSAKPIANDYDIRLKNYSHQAIYIASNTRLLCDFVKLALCMVDILHKNITNPIGLIAVLVFMEIVMKDMEENIVNPGEKVDRKNNKWAGKIGKIIHEFKSNQNIIHESMKEGAYLDSTMHAITRLYDTYKSSAMFSDVNANQRGFSVRYEAYVILLSLVTPKSTETIWVYDSLLAMCHGLNGSRIAHSNIQNQIRKLRLDKLAKTHIQPMPKKGSAANVNIDLISRGVLFRFDKFAFKPADRLIFTVQKNMQIPSMKWITMIGSSGSGKTSLCNLCLRPTHATGAAGANIAFLGEYSNYSYDAIRRYVSHVRPHSDIFENKSIYFNLTFGVSLGSTHLKTLVGEYLEQFELGHLAAKLHAKIRTLSTGEKQRVKLIRCILHDKPIWVLDEGTANIDGDCEEKLLRLLRDIQIRKRKSVIHVTHNLAMTRFGDYLVTIQDKRVTIKKTPVE
jgi:ABC-type lipoprotein export system ATPase subunit